jgi:GNAT superfamily N-acetyltransferase
VTAYVVRDLRPQDRDAVYRFLSEGAYWSIGLPREIFDRSVDGSLCFVAATTDDEVAGFARVVTDRATFAWLCDVYVPPEHRGNGVSRRLMDAVMSHPDLADVRNFVLATRDAHGLYAKYGFAPLAEPARWMAIQKPYR